MSNLDRAPALTRGGLGAVSARPTVEVFPGREVPLSGGPPASGGVAGGGESTLVRRLLPNLGRRLVGPWCFIDHYGPDDVAAGPGMQVPPHPHIGLQTVSWLLDGEVHHRDCLGSDSLISPGQLGVMTAGRGICHSEQSPVPHPALLHGVQLWLALPDAHRNADPAWQHVPDLPTLANEHLHATVFMGTLADTTSPGTAFSPLVGADIALTPRGDDVLATEPDFEYAVLVMDGAVEVDGTTVGVGALGYLGTGRAALRLTEPHGRPARLMLLGGAPFEEQIVMWWNFVGRDTEEIAQARADWEDGTRFGVVRGYTDGPAIPAPPMPAGRLKPGGAVRERKS